MKPIDETGCAGLNAPSEERESAFDVRFPDNIGNPTALHAYRDDIKDFIRETRTAAYEKGRQDESKNCTGCTKQAAEAITEAENHGYEKGVRDSLEVVKKNRKGAFTDDAGHDCWYVDELTTAISTLLK